MFLSPQLANVQTGLEVSAEETKYLFMSRDQYAGQMYSIKQVINSVKGWKSSNIWRQPSQIKIAFTKKLRED